MDKTNIKWRDWAKKLNDHYEERYGMRLKRNDLPAWRDYFDDGYTPGDALADENTYS